MLTVSKAFFGKDFLEYHFSKQNKYISNSLREHKYNNKNDNYKFIMTRIHNDKNNKQYI